MKTFRDFINESSSRWADLRSKMKWLPKLDSEEIEDAIEYAEKIRRFILKNKKFGNIAEKLFTKDRLGLDAIEYEISEIIRLHKELPWIEIPDYNEFVDGNGWNVIVGDILVALNGLNKGAIDEIKKMYKKSKLSLEDLYHEIVEY